MSYYQKLKDSFYENLVKPVLESCSPVNQAAWGAAIGMAVGMTPTVGIQLWMVAMIWFGVKYSTGRKFDLVIAMAMVWVSNVFTMIPLYYGFLIAGNWFFKLMGRGGVAMSYQEFGEKLGAIIHNSELSTWDSFVQGMEFLILDLGYPMVVGSVFWAVPLGVLSYFLTARYLIKSRTQKAEKMGMTYEAWRDQFEKSTE